MWEAPLVENPACTVGCGKWTLPMIPNPAYKGVWKPPKIPNPKYKGLWRARQLPHPHHFHDLSPFASLAPMGALAVEVLPCPTLHFYTLPYQPTVYIILS